MIGESIPSAFRPCVHATLFSVLAYLLIVLSVVRVCTLVSREIEIRGAKYRVRVNCVTSCKPITAASINRSHYDAECTLVDRDNVRSIWHNKTLRQRLVDAVIEKVVEANRRVCFLGSGKIRDERVESEPCNLILCRPPKTDTHNPFFGFGSAKLP